MHIKKNKVHKSKFEFLFESDIDDVGSFIANVEGKAMSFVIDEKDRTRMSITATSDDGEYTITIDKNDEDKIYVPGYEQAGEKKDGEEVDFSKLFSDAIEEILPVIISVLSSNKKK